MVHIFSLQRLIEISDIARMAENVKEEEKEPKVATPEDILKASGNDELKFGLLIGLIKVGQVSNKDVVDTVLYLVSTIKEKTVSLPL